jgi:hypothetical protein
MPLVGFEATIPAFERANIVHAIDRAATMIVAIILSDLNWEEAGLDPDRLFCSRQL